MTSVKSADRERSSKAATRRKYLGEANDPHFVPGSPIISRQSLPLELEEELTRSCSVMLAGVQHADDNEEDPLMKYITAQIAPIKPARTTNPKDKSVRSKSSVSTRSQPSQKSQNLRRVNADTATPSDSSRRNTVHRTNTSTPLTVLSESARLSSGHKQNAAPRNEVRRSKSQAFYESLKSRSGDSYQDTALATKSTSSLTSLEAAIERQSAKAMASKGIHVSVTHVDLNSYNKHLPPLPDLELGHSTEKQPTGFSRLLRTVRNKQTSPVTSPMSQKSIDFHPKRAQTPCDAAPTRRSRMGFASLFDRGKRKQQAQSATQ